LGILAVTAAPRFLNLQSDARASSLQGLKGAMAGAGSIVYGKAAIEGLETSAASSVTDGNVTITTVYGYPAATSGGIGNAVEGLNDANGDWTEITSDGTTIEYTFSSESSTSTDCKVTYTMPSTEGATPTISAATADDC
jgi:MSHA pilin protein MshA